MQIYKSDSTEIHYRASGNPDGPTILWAHGWGQSHAAFLPFTQSFQSIAHHITIDFPGFGASPVPHAAWSTADYADAMAEFIKSLKTDTIIWVGHSFGCRVGLQMAINHPDLISGLFLIGGAGLRRKRSLLENISLYSKVYTFKACKKLVPLGLNENWIKSKFGSPDYRNAGPMRPIMLKVNAEDLTNTVGQITCPVKLAYGTKDTETPPEIGKRLSKLIKDADFIEFEGLDHYTILGASRHQVTPHLKKFIEQLTS